MSSAILNNMAAEAAVLRIYRSLRFSAFLRNSVTGQILHTYYVFFSEKDFTVRQFVL